jgi:hypothetical protein
MATKSLEAPEVIVTWVDDPEADMINMLNSYTGVRVYARDAIDRRAYLGDELPPYFDDFTQALDYMRAHPRKVCQLDKRLAARLGLL